MKFAERSASGWWRREASFRAPTSWSTRRTCRRFQRSPAARWWPTGSGKRPDPKAYNLASVVDDGGATWSPPVTPHHDGTKTQHGFASLFQAPGAGLGLVWLDGRAADPESPKATGNVSLRAAVFIRAGGSRGNGRSTSGYASAPDFRRHHIGGTSYHIPRRRMRRSAIFSSRGWRRDDGRRRRGHTTGGRSSVPVNGAAISARGRDVAVAWFSAKDGPHAYVALSRDAGRRAALSARVDEVAAIGHVRAVHMFSDGSAAVSWVEFADQQAQFKIRRITSNGGTRQRSRSRERETIASPAGQGLVRSGNDLVLAWTETNKGGAPRANGADGDGR